MPKIFELFGFPLAVQTKEAIECRKAARCPFMGSECDGGGNRFASDVNLDSHPTLRDYFGKQGVVPSGVCSIQLNDDEPPWIVCPEDYWF